MSPVAHPISHGYIAICLHAAGWVAGVCAWGPREPWPVGVFGRNESALEFQRISPAPMGSVHTSGRSRPLPIILYFPRSTLGHSRRCHFIKGSPPAPPHGCVPYPPLLLDWRCDANASLPLCCPFCRHRSGRRSVLWPQRRPIHPPGKRISPRVSFMGGTNDFPSHFTLTGTTHQSLCQTPRLANATP